MTHTTPRPAVSVLLLALGCSIIGKAVAGDNRCPLGVPAISTDNALPDCDCSDFFEGDVICGSNIGPPLYECRGGTWTIKDECSCGTYVDCKGQTLEVPHSCVSNDLGTKSWCGACSRHGCTDFKA